MQIKSIIKNPMSSRVVGIEEDLKEINSRLCGELSSKLEIIPIVGMGGIGKTTLARYAYDNPLNVHHFYLRAWVTISQRYDLRGILLWLLRSIKNVTDNKRSEELFRKGEYKNVDVASLKEQVYRSLKWRRYLIVMDDMWYTNVWDDLRSLFSDDCNGSRIIITTRELNVASYVDSLNHPPHEMRLMSVDQSWRLLKEKVFGQGSCPHELEEIGELIAEKCRGLPLAIVVIAGVLSKLNQMQDSWEKIAQNVSEAVNTSGEQFSDILSVSDKHLPDHLRPCFLYMALFPEDYEINVSEVIRLWAGEGFLLSNESIDMEELGYEYLEDLARRSLVLIEKKRHDGKIKAVKIHDVLRDLCLRKCRDENFVRNISEFPGSIREGIENSRRLSICSDDDWACIPNMERVPINTILFFLGREGCHFDEWKHLISKLLRVLKAMTITLPRYPVEMSELIHLRYLAFTYESFDRTVELQLPESLSKLQNLQTIVIRRLWNRQFTACLPITVWRMPQLRHIILLNGFLPDPSCRSETLPLGNLHALSRITNLTCSGRILEMLPNLKKLGIFYSYEGTCEKGWSEFGLSSLVHLRTLEKLSLYAEPDLNLKNDLSKNLAFPATLRKLTLSCCRFPWEDMTIVGSLPNLEVLKLKRDACFGTKWETSEGEFCQLKVLLIDSSTDLHQWITERFHFPRLVRLTLYECNHLEEIPYVIGEIPTLQLIEVDVWNLPIVKSAQAIQEEQESYGNDLRVSFLKSRSWTW